MDGLCPGEDGIGTIYRRHRGAERIVDRGAFLFGGWRERKKGKLGSSINLEDDG